MPLKRPRLTASRMRRVDAMHRSALRTILPVIFLFTLPAVSQNLPKQIRGYNVHREGIVIMTGNEKPGEKPTTPDAIVKIGDPVPADI